jgi:putative phage-type endonuclease
MTRAEWLAWRKEGIGGSDAPIIMEVSPWKTIGELYEDKVAKEIVDSPPNFQQERGIRMEPRIRSLFEILANESYETALLVMDQFPFMRVSLDGRSANREVIIEIKVSGKADWTASKEHGIVPKKYYPQIQHALLISGAKECIYLSYLWTKTEEMVLDREKLAIIKVMPDPAYQKTLFEKCEAFWTKNVQRRIHPQFVVRENEVEIDPEETEQAKKVLAWKILDDQIKELSARQEAMRKDIVDFMTRKGMKDAICNGVRIREMKRAGNIDYKKIPEIQGLDLEQYRGKEILFWKMELQK